MRSRSRGLVAGLADRSQKGNNRTRNENTMGNEARATRSEIDEIWERLTELDKRIQAAVRHASNFDYRSAQAQRLAEAISILRPKNGDV